MFFDESWWLKHLGRRSPKIHFCLIILKSVQWFLTRRFLKFSIHIYRENKPHYTETDPTVFDNKIFKVVFFFVALATRILHGFQTLNNFHSVSPKNQSCENWLELAQWFRSSCLKKFWTDRRTSRWWPMVSDLNNSLWAFGSGELKKY